MTRIHFILFPCNPCRPYLKNHQIHFDATPFTGAALPFYLFFSVRFQIFIGFAEMLVSEKAVVCGKGRRVGGCQYQVLVAIYKGAFSLRISSP